MSAKAIAGNDIFVENPTRDMIAWAKQTLILDNPDYHKKLRLGKWTGGTPDKIYLYETVGGNLRLPFGCLRGFYSRFRNTCEFIGSFHAKRNVRYHSSIVPYEYQEQAVKVALQKKNGIIVMPCGSGKTQTALELISRIGGTCLWLTHTQDLLNQSMNRAKSVLSTYAKYGKITGGKVNIGEGITFATVQTMCNIDLDRHKNDWDIIIVDECQHCCGSPTRVTQFYKVVNNLSARYKFGLTATPKRSDGLERAMFALLGDTVYTVSKEDVAHTTCPIRIKTVETNYFPDYDAVLMGDGTIDYSKLVDNLINDPDRFELVLNTIRGLDEPTIVLANRIEYLKRLSEIISKEKRCVCLSTLGTSKASRELRKNALTDLDTGKIDMIFATYQLAKEGLDVPGLRYVVFATPEKDETTVTQAVGRVGRKADGKEFGTVIDFIDNFGMYYGWAKIRKRYYRKLGAEVLE